MPNKLHILTQGCQMNEYDSSRMGDLLCASHGLVLTSRPEDADVLLLNTCAVREKAQEKVFSELGRWKELKALKPGVVIGVGGCVASQEGEALHKRAPFVDIVFGPQTLHRLPAMLSERLASNRSAPALVDISFPEIEKFDHLPPPRSDGPTAFVSVMEGCSKYCTFCVVPYTRGDEVSRPLRDVLTEVEQLARQGVREVTFLGQNVNAYRGALHESDGDAGDYADLAELIVLTAEIPGIGRIRYTTSHPLEVQQSLIDVYAQVPQLASHLHLPVQSGSDRILAGMKRGYTALEYKSKVRKLRAVRPNLALSSDFIVGFPGETEADFVATMNLIQELNFDASFSFLYSPRPGTPAAALPDETPDDAKRLRLTLLQDRLRLQSQAFSQKRVGTVQHVLITGRSHRDPGQLRARCDDNRIVNFRHDDDGLIGHFANVAISEALTNSLRGEFVAVAE